ncbi:hypothetical protein KCP78_06225 [Salmonella enterica subsp. enterica]|nr:hypothetical protein KCP78_06225 [Salmonella enterica subsp. enterica]
MGAQIASIPAEKSFSWRGNRAPAEQTYICGAGDAAYSTGSRPRNRHAVYSPVTSAPNGGNSGVRGRTGSGASKWFSMLEGAVKEQISGLYTDRRYHDHEDCGNDARDGVRGKTARHYAIRILWCCAGNTLINQHGDIAHPRISLQDGSKCEMIVGIDDAL